LVKSWLVGICRRTLGEESIGIGLIPVLLFITSVHVFFTSTSFLGGGAGGAGGMDMAKMMEQMGGMGGMGGS
jgi:hypothetical protein